MLYLKLTSDLCTLLRSCLLFTVSLTNNAIIIVISDGRLILILLHADSKLKFLSRVFDFQAGFFFLFQMNWKDPWMYVCVFFFPCSCLALLMQVMNWLCNSTEVFIPF